MSRVRSFTIVYSPSLRMCFPQLRICCHPAGITREQHTLAVKDNDEVWTWGCNGETRGVPAK